MSFVVDVLLEEKHEVLQVPVVKPKSLKKLLTANAPRIPLLGSSNVPTTDDSLEQFLHHVGTLFGKDPTKWEKVGDTKTEVTEEDGKRIIKRTGMFTGTELHLWYTPQYFDPRLPARPDQPHLEFAVQRKQIKSTDEWQQLTADQPWSPSRRRQLLLNFLRAKLEAEDDQLQLEGARGMWEISINKPHHAELELVHLKPLVELLQSTNIEVARTCAAAMWGFAVNERSRGLLLQLNVVGLLLQLTRQSLTLACIADPDYQETYLAGGKCSQTQRNQLQASVLGSLSVMLVDSECRRPLIALEPGCDVLFQLSSNLEGYADKAWAAARKEAAAKAITSLIQRDHEARTQLIATGGIAKILGLLDSKGPGSSRVQYCMASVLATLVLDEGAMDIIKQRHEGHLMFEATLRLLSHVMNALKFALAVGGDQIMSEGMTEDDVRAAMQQRQMNQHYCSAGQGEVGQPVSQMAFRRLSQQDAVSSLSGGPPALARRVSTDAQQVAALLAEASVASKLSSSETARSLMSQQENDVEAEDVHEPLDVKTAVSLAEACAQALWGSAHYSLEEPLHITQDHVIELGKLGLDCILISELDLGRVCHCLSATLASLASHEKTASFIMDAPGDSVAKAMLALLEVEDEPGLSNSGHIRAAASTCLAFLACHPIGAKGDSCLHGPFRERLLGIGAFGALLKAALACSVDDPCDAIIQQTAAVGIMYMSTMAGAVDSAELAMYAALMTSNTNIQMVEYLMAGMWILLKHPSNRQVLGGAFQINPAASMLTKNMISKLHDTIDVANVNETAEMLTKMRQTGLSTRKLGPAISTRQLGATGLSADGGCAFPQGDPPASTPPHQAGKTLAEWKQGTASSTECPDAANTGVIVGVGVSDIGQQRVHTAATSSAVTSSRPATRAGSPPGRLMSESSFGASAAEADTMEDKLQLVQSKRKSVLFNNIASGGCPEPLQPNGAPGHVHAPLSMEEVSEAMNEGPGSKRTIERMKSMDKSLNRRLTNLDKQLGSGLEDNWGLDVLVRVGETWLPKLADSSVVPRGQSMAGCVQPLSTDREAEARADVPLLKLFEFLTASLCLYVIEEEPVSPLHRTANVYSSSQAPGTPNKSGPGWWTVAAPMMPADPELSPLLHRTVHILMTVLRLRLPAAWKILQLSVVMLWIAAVQSANVEKHQVAEGVCSILLDIINSRLWPPTLRDLASGHLQFLMETHDNLLKMGQEWQQQRLEQQQQQQQPARQNQRGRGQTSGTGSTTSGNSISSSRSPGKPSLTSLSTNKTPGGQGDAVQQANPLPFNLQALLNPTAAAAAAAGGGRFKLKQQKPPDPVEEAVSAAGSHVGLVPVMSCFVSLLKTGHPLLELSGARGIARVCFAGSMGASTMSQLLAEAKATAAVVGALGALVDLLKMTATKLMVLEDGGQLPPLPLLTHLVDKQYGIYERDVNNWEGVLELLTVLLAAMLNLSTLRANQPRLARKGLMVLLRTNTSLYQVISCRDAPTEVEMKLLDLLAAIIQNLSSHPDNRTHMYRAELAGTAALDRVLEGSVSPEPTETSAALLATRLTGHISAAAAAAGGNSGVGRAASSAALQPDHTASSAQGVCDHPMQGNAGVDTVVAAAAVLRPKVVFPPISRGAGDLGGNIEAFRASSPSSPTAAGSGWPGSPTAGQAELVAVAAGLGRPPAIIPPRTAGLRTSQGPRSLRSRGGVTSVAGMPGSPAIAPDNREQFLIWMDSTFLDVNEGGIGISGEDGAGKERRTYRRQLWDEQGDWLQQEPESAQALQRLLCRPLKHLWQDSPEARARAGNARWCPAVSEYRQANPKYPLQHAAEELITTAPPQEAGDLLEATAQLTTMGRCEFGTMSLDRPSTRERMRGRVPMTVLEPSAQLLTGTVTAAPACASDGEQQQADSSTSRSGSDTWQHQSAQNSAAGQQQQQQQLDASTGVLAATSPRIPLKVVLSPQRPRTVISFENRVFTSDGPGSRPVLTMWQHAEGSKVSKGLFQEYSLPNGRKCFMYCNSGSVMDEAEVPPVWPPARPTTVPLALQQSMPLAQVLDIMSKPPGSAPPFVPWKPVPRLVSLPGSHTLTVSRPEQLDSAAYGRLRPDNLQLSITAQAIMKSQSTVTEESVAVQLAETREPWTLPSSIFKPRVKEADARAFYDGGATLDKMFERDWTRACGKEKFTSMLARENKGNAAGKSDKQAMQDVHDMLKRNYQAFYSIFVYYACGGNDPYHMPLNSYSSLLDDAGIPDPDSLSCKRSDCDTIFIVCNFQPDKNSPDVAVNDEHAMMRFEFMEAVVRLALAKYGKGQSTTDLGIAVELLFERNLLPRLPPMAMLVSNDFRTGRLYTEEVDMLLKQHQPLLKALYSRYRLKPNGGGLRPKVLKLDGWLALMADAKLVDSQFTLADANLAFLWSRMYVVDEIKDYVRYTTLTFIDFLEAIGRVADSKSLPTASDLDAVGYSSILEWALEKERMEGGNNQGGNNVNVGAAGSAPTGVGDSEATAAATVCMSRNLPDIFRPRLSATFGAPKPRPLYAKLEILLDLIFRRLHWDPAEPDSVFSYEGLLRMVKKIDKDLGP